MAVIPGSVAGAVGIKTRRAATSPASVRSGPGLSVQSEGSALAWSVVPDRPEWIEPVPGRVQSPPSKDADCRHKFRKELLAACSQHCAGKTDSQGNPMCVEACYARYDEKTGLCHARAICKVCSDQPQIFEAS